jgi:peptidoglycan/LPS O-acetylase OafA/YrhL
MQLKLRNTSELRLLFAAVVFINHAIQLGGFYEYRWLQNLLSSELAVYGFFILSGYLIFGSVDRSASLKQYYVRRVLRIFPAYFVSVVVFPAIILTGWFNAGMPVNGREVLSYLTANLMFLNFLHPKLDGVFQNNSFMEVNGALWSIKVEVMFYLLAPILVSLARRYSYGIVGALMIISGLGWVPMLVVVFGADSIQVRTLSHQLPGQLLYFGLGVLLYHCAKSRCSNRRQFLALVLVSIAVGIIQNPKAAFGLVCLVITIVSVIKMPQLSWQLDKNDISYGIYLCHFPIIQLLISNGVHTLGLIVYVLVAAALASVYGFLSWRFVEVPAIAFAKSLDL